MSWYVDTSAFVKLVVAEEHSDALRDWAERHSDGLIASDLLVTEALRTARRHSPEALSQTRSALDALTILHLGPDVFARAAELDPAILRSLDALHLAAALSAGDDLEGLVTYDDRLRATAALHGITVLAPT